MKVYVGIFIVGVVSILLNRCNAAPAYNEDVSNLLNSLKSNKDLLNLLNNPNILSKPSASVNFGNILSNPSAMSLIGNALKDPNTLTNIENAIRDPANAQAIADTLTDPNAIARIIKDPNTAINTGINKGISKAIEVNQANLIITAITNLLESLKNSNETNSTSIQNQILDFLINATNNNPEIINAIKPILPRLVDVYNRLNPDQLTNFLNETLNKIDHITNSLANFNLTEFVIEVIANGNQNLTNLLINHFYEFVPELINKLQQTNGTFEEVWPIIEPVLISHLAILLDDQSISNSSTPFADALTDICNRMKAMNYCIISNNSQVEEILIKFVSNFETTKSFEAALESIKNDTSMLLFDSYINNPNIPDILKSSMVLEMVSKFSKTYMDTMNLIEAFESVESDFTNLIVDELIQLLTNLTTNNEREKKIVIKFFEEWRVSHNITAAFEPVKNETFALLYEILMANPNVPSFLKNVQVQALISEFLENYSTTMNITVALASIKNETLHLLYNDFMADPNIPAIFKSKEATTIISKFASTYKQTMNLTAAFESVKEDILSFGIAIFLADPSQLPAFLQTPEAQAVISEFASKYMESMDVVAAFDSIKKDLVSFVLDMLYNVTETPEFLKSPEIKEILNTFLTNYIETFDLAKAGESIKNETFAFILSVIPSSLKTNLTQTFITDFLEAYRQTPEISYALEIAGKKYLGMFIQSLMTDPAVPQILKEPEVQAIAYEFFSTYKSTMNLTAAFDSIKNETVIFLFELLSSDSNNTFLNNTQIQEFISVFFKNFEQTQSLDAAFDALSNEISEFIEEEGTTELKAFISGISPTIFDLIKNETSISGIIDTIKNAITSWLSKLGLPVTSSSVPTTKSTPLNKNSLLENSILRSFDQKALEADIDSLKERIGQILAVEFINALKWFAQSYAPGLNTYIENQNDIISITNSLFKYLNKRAVDELLSLGFTELPTTTTTTTTQSTTTPTTTTTKTTTSTVTNAINQQIIDIINQIEKDNQNNINNIIGTTNQPKQTLPIFIEWG